MAVSSKECLEIRNVIELGHGKQHGVVAHVVYCVCPHRVIFSSKEGEFAYLTRGGDPAVFVKSKEDQISRKQER